MVSIAVWHQLRSCRVVLAGNSQYLNERDFDPPTQFRLTKKCVMYDPRNRTVHDIMVCFVQQPFMESLYVSKVNVVGSSVPTNLTCIVTGFGLSDESHKQCLVGRSILQEIPNTWDCPGIHARGPTSICTRDTKTQAVCPGDLGAAAICRVGGNLHLVAVATGVIYSRMKPHSCTVGVEGNVYVQVHTYAKWMKKMVTDLNDQLEREPLPPWLPSREPESHDRDEGRSGTVRPQVSGLDVVLSLLFLVLKDLVATDRCSTRHACRVGQVSSV
ncbi:uncharacterized protein LOC126291781 [Schistocerca gregaria]|uniref:uncharacterized protein LOC126291781 n=1 Tax=Schistocerca gregaria TaxID=7010 RepID=UPI00211E4CDA|nr:uncharacterized protein LOC126291781 [Schistocerca gregaria]